MGQGSQLLRKLPFAPIIGLLFGLVTAILIFDTPQWLFERMVASTGLPDLLPAAKPPLGQTARILSAIAFGLMVAAALGGLLHLVERKLARKPKHRGERPRGVRIDSVSKARGHRAPIFAEQELGAPFMSDEAMEVARNELVLEEPAELVAEAPAAVTSEVDALVQDIHTAPTLLAPAASEFDEQPEPEPLPVVAVATVTPPVHGAEDDASISGLLDRLENALERRQARNISGSPIPAGDIAALRKALGVAR